MVSRKGDDQPRIPPDHGSEPSRWDKFMAKHAGTVVPVSFLVAFVALMIYGMCGSR